MPGRVQTSSLGDNLLLHNRARGQERRLDHDALVYRRTAGLAGGF
jgi:hypothetical protein